MDDKPNILLIDDDQDFLRLVELQLLKSERFSINTTTSADSALITIQKNRPDLIVLDLRMPGKSGFWLYQQLKSDEDLVDIPVVILSGMIKRGKNQVLPERDAAKGIISLWKPVDPNILLATIITELLRTRRNSAP